MTSVAMPVFSKKKETVRPACVWVGHHVLVRRRWVTLHFCGLKPCFNLTGIMCTFMYCMRMRVCVHVCVCVCVCMCVCMCVCAAVPWDPARCGGDRRAPQGAHEAGATLHYRCH